MREYLLVILILFLSVLHLIGQNLAEIEVKPLKTPETSLCTSDCHDCGKLIFSTFIPHLDFVSDLENIQDWKVDSIRSGAGRYKFIHHVVTKAKLTQFITVRGPNLVDYSLQVDSLEEGRCQNYLIYLPLTSVKLNSVPSGARFAIEGESDFKAVTPYTIEDHAPGTYNVTFTKDGYNPLITTFTILENRTSELTVSLTPKPTGVQSSAATKSGQPIREIETKPIELPEFTICTSDCMDCGKLTFFTPVSNLEFISDMGHIREWKVDSDNSNSSQRKFTHQLVVRALPIQNIKIIGPDIADYILEIDSLGVGDCRNYIINYVGNPNVQPTLFKLNSDPSGATIVIYGTPDFKEVTPYLIDDYAPGTYSVTFSKEGYNTVNETITIQANRTLGHTVSLSPVSKNDINRTAYLQIINLLSDVGATNTLSNSNLNQAAFTSEIRKMIAQGAPLDKRDGDGNTALILATKIGAVEVVKDLIRNNADMKVRNNRGQSAKQIANNSKNKELKSVFKQSRQVYLIPFKFGLNTTKIDDPKTSYFTGGDVGFAIAAKVAKRLLIQGDFFYSFNGSEIEDDEAYQPLFMFPGDFYFDMQQISIIPQLRYELGDHYKLHAYLLAGVGYRSLVSAEIRDFDDDNNGLDVLDSSDKSSILYKGGLGIGTHLTYFEIAYLKSNKTQIHDINSTLNTISFTLGIGF